MIEEKNMLAMREPLTPPSLQFFSSFSTMFATPAQKELKASSHSQSDAPTAGSWRPGAASAHQGAEFTPNHITAAERPPGRSLGAVQAEEKLRLGLLQNNLR